MFLQILLPHPSVIHFSVIQKAMKILTHISSITEKENCGVGGGGGNQIKTKIEPDTNYCNF